MEREADTILGPIPLMSPPFGCHYPTFLDAQASLAPTHVCL